MDLKKVADRAEAAALLGVSELYLRQQASMREPSGAVMAAIRKDLRHASDAPVMRSAAETLELARALAKKSGRPLVECIAQLAAQGRPVPGEYAGIAEAARAAAAPRTETIARHNARVLAERQAKRGR